MTERTGLAPATVDAAGAAPAGGPGAPPLVMGRRERLAVGLLLLSTFVVILNETVMGVALPRLMADLDITASTAQWVTTAFMLTMAVVIPVTGFVLQRATTRRTFLAAMTLFSVGTLVCALAPGFAVLILGRVVQATGTAIMLPLLMTTVMTVTPVASRGRTMGNISIVISVAPALGPTISGLVLSVLDWRWLFGLVLPIAVGALVLGALRLPDLTTPRPAAVDVPSVLLSAGAFGGLVYGLSRIGESAGAGLAPALVPLLGGAVLLAVFVHRQRRLGRREAALLDLRVFASRTFTLSAALLSVSMLALFGTIIVLPLYTQTVLGLSAVQTGLLVLPGGLLMGLLAPWVGRAFDRVGARPLVVPGTLLVSGASWGMVVATGTGSPWLLGGLYLLLSAGLALLFTPLFTAGLGALPPHLYPHGSAVVGTSQQVAGAAGTALFITVMTAVTLASADGGAGALDAATSGVRAAFLAGAVLSLVAVPLALVLRVPAGAGGPGGPAH